MMAKIQVMVTVTFINLITGKKGETVCFCKDLPAPQFLYSSDEVMDVSIGDGEGTIWGEGNCVYRLKIKDFSEADGVIKVILKDTEFSENFQKEFGKNWTAIKNQIKV